MLLMEPPVRGFDLQIEMHGDLAGFLHRGRCLQGQAKILVLNLRDGCMGASELISRLEALTPLMVTPASADAVSPRCRSCR